jgi:hypothetical protein
MKMLKGPAPVAAAPVAAPPAAPAPGTTETAVPPLGAPATAAGTPASAVPASSSEPAVLGSTEEPLPGGPGQLLSFEHFESKDPFAQQADVSAVPAAPNAPADDEPLTVPAAGPSTPAPGAGSTPVDGGSAVPPADRSSATPPGAAGGSAPSPAAPSGTPQAAAPAPATTISVDGVSGPVELGKEFPLERPTFVLVSAAKDGKSVKLGIAGGRYADGAAAITLRLGKPLTLRNTADGSLYELELQTVAGFVPPKSKQ